MTAVDTFDVAPEFPATVRFERGVVTTSKGEGLSLRRQTTTAYSRNSTEKRTRVWTLRWERGTHGQAERIRDLHSASLFGSRTLNYTPAHGDGASPSSMEVRMRTPRISQSRRSASSYAMVVELEEYV